MATADAPAPDGPDPPEPVLSAAPRPRLSAWVLVAIGLAVGVGAGSAVAGVRLRSRTPAAASSPPGFVATPGPKPSALAADALLAAMRRSQVATFALVEDFVRVAPSGVEVVATRTTRVQRPPDSLLRTDSVVDRVLVGRHTACSTAPDSGGQLRCRTEPAVAVDVEAGVAEQAKLLTGAAPLYTVADAGGGCFSLVLRVERPAPPYGRRATLCFDARTGAPSRSEITKASGTGAEVIDRTTASAIRSTVSDADLALPPGTSG